MHIGIGLFLRTQRAGGISPGAAIAALFANGEQGGWYDPSDMTSMMRDGIGTPVTAAGQSVAMLMDKRLGMARGPELVPNPTFANGTGWTVTGADGTHIVTFGSGGGMRYQSGTTSPALGVSGAINANTASAYEVTVVVSQWVSGSIKVSESANGFITINGPGTFKMIMRSGIASFTRLTANVDMTFASISIREVLGSHAWQATAGSRPTYQIDGLLPYLAFDGVDDVLVSDAINMTGTSQLTVCSGFRKESDVGIALLAEFSDNLNNRAGSWYIAAPIEAAKPGLAFVAKGTNAQYLDQIGYPAPVKAVLTAQSDLVAPMTNMRINGVQNMTSAGDLGSGTFGNWQLYVGMRGATTQAFTGRVYGLIVRGAASTMDQVTTMETYMNSKTGAF